MQKPLRACVGTNADGTLDVRRSHAATSVVCVLVNGGRMYAGREVYVILDQGEAQQLVGQLADWLREIEGTRWAG